ASGAPVPMRFPWRESSPTPRRSVAARGNLPAILSCKVPHRRVAMHAPSSPTKSTASKNRRPVRGGWLPASKKGGGSPWHRRRRLPAVGLLAPLLAVALVTGCGQTPPPADKKAVEVVVSTPVNGEVTDYQDFTGRLDALKTVDIRARVTGFVTS